MALTTVGCIKRASVLSVLVLSIPVVVDAQTGKLEEVVVTARKQIERLEETPISLTVFTADAIERRDAVEITKLVEGVPNMQFDVGTSFGSSSALSTVHIRGIGQNESQLAVDPGVGIYVDGVYLNRIVGQTIDLIDIERIEVLRGPQGTLFGRNTIAGAINITTKRPGDTLEGSASLQSGTDWDTVIRGTVSGPLSESVRAGGALMYHYRDNYINGVWGADDVGEKNAVSGRLLLDADFSDAVTLALSFDGTWAHEPGIIGVPIAYYDGSAFGGAHNAFFSGAPEVCLDFASTARFSDPRCYNSQWLVGRFSHAGTYATPESHQTVFETVHGHRFKSHQDLDLWGISATLGWEISEHLQFKSISAYRSASLNLAHDGDHSPHLIVHTDEKHDIDQVTQEFQLLGDALDGRLHGLVGAYYFYEDGVSSQIVDTDLTMFYSGAVIETDSYALFGQSTIDITERVSLTGGLRWTDEKKTFSAGDRFVILADFGLGIPAGTPILPIGQVVDAKDSSVTPMASLNVALNEEVNVYFSYSEGSKGGGFTQTVFPAAPTIPKFSPEKLNSYELGLKYFGLDHRVRLSGAVFYGDYKDIQVTVIEGVAPTIRNAAAGRIFGFELQNETLLNDAIRLEAGVGYLDAKYTKVAGEAALAGLTEDKKFVNAPKWTLNAALAFDHHLPHAGAMMSRLEWSYRSKTYNDAINTPEIAQPAFYLINASLAYTTSDESWRISAGVQNLNDKKFLMSGYADPAGIGDAEGVYDRGRTMYLKVSKVF